ncbi:MAG: nucleoside permease [Chitinophagaceae bacterium]
MNLKLRLIVMNFLQFFIWGSWLLTIGAYWFQNKGWSGSEFGIIFSTMGISALVMPSLTGILADKIINAERLFSILHILGAVMLFCLPQVGDPSTFFWVMLVNMIFYMPTISLSITIAYTSLKNADLNIIKVYPPIRVWGTVGFIAAMWMVSLLGLEKSSSQFYIAGAASIVLAVYSLTLPKCLPLLKGMPAKSFVESLGLNAFKLFKSYKMALFFLFSMLLGAALQLTNAYGDTYLHEFANVDAYKETIAVKYPAIIMSISQVSETLFILAIPFFLRRFGIKNVMFFSMIAWVLRFGLLAFGNPADGLWMVIVSCIVYGMAFDFFNISGSLFVETQADPAIRASSQGLFMMMVNGVGAIFGSLASGFLIQRFFTDAEGHHNWQSIWITFASYAAVIAVLFFVLFKHKHDPKEVEGFSH